MTLILTEPDKQQVDKEIAMMRKTSKKTTKSKETARAYLLKYGFITPKGKLTKRYGG